MRRIVIGLAAAGVAAYVWYRRNKEREPVSTKPRIAFGNEANLAFYAARFAVGSDAIEPEHVLACALYDPRLEAYVRSRGVAVETARADLIADARHRKNPAVEPHDYNSNENYNGAAISLRWLVTGRRSHELAARRGATVISLGDLLRAMRERGGLLAELIPADEAGLAAFDVERTIDVSQRVAAGDDVTGEVDVFAVNDDKTSMGMVLSVLTSVWECTAPRAAFVMLETHDKGHGFVGRYPAATARERVARATVAARERDMPLTFALYI